LEVIRVNNKFNIPLFRIGQVGVSQREQRRVKSLLATGERGMVSRINLMKIPMDVGAQGLHWLQLKKSLSKKSHNESSGKAGKRRLRNG